MRITKSAIKTPTGKTNPDVSAMIRQWSLDYDKLRRGLKTLPVFARDDVVLSFADEFMTKTLGAMTLAWAIMERALDDVVGLVFTSDPGHAIQSTLPVTLDNKLDYLRKARAALPWLAPFVDPMRGQQNRIKLARAHRKNVTHGVLAVSLDDYEKWNAKVLDFVGPESTERAVEYDPKAVFGTILEIDALTLDLQSLLGHLRVARDAAK